MSGPGRAPGQGDFPGRAWQEGGRTILDTRGLAPPDPMVAILWHVERAISPLTVLMDREPIHLFPELAQRGWKWELADATPGAVRLVLRQGR